MRFAFIGDPAPVFLHLTHPVVLVLPDRDDLRERVKAEIARYGAELAQQVREDRAHLGERERVARFRSRRSRQRRKY